MSEIAKLTVALYANSTQFTSELNKSQKTAKTWSDSVSKTLSIATKATAAAAVTAAGSLAVLYKQQAAWIDQTAKHADTLGISTEALTQFRHAAELTGVGSKNLDTSLQRMTRRIAEAAAGSGEAKDVLNELGVSAKQLSQSTPEEQLYVLADAFSQVENQSDRVRYAFKLFDSEGVKMANMLAGGAGSLRSMADEADALGITLSRVDAAKIEMANDAMYKVSASTQAWSKSIAVELAPILAALSDEITSATRAAGGFGVVTSEVFDGVVKGVAFASDVWRGWDLIINSAITAAYGYRLAMMKVWQGVIDGAVQAGETITKAVAWPLQQTLEVAGAFNDSAAEMAASLEAITTFKPPKLFNVADAQLEYSQALWELRDLASQPLPSDGIESWYQAVKVRIQEAAELYADNVKRNSGSYSLPIAPGNGDEAQKESPAVTSFREATDNIMTEYNRRLALLAAGDQADAARESFAYADRQARLSEQFQAAYDATANNQALQQQLEDQYFASRELLWQEHQANITDIEKKAAKARYAAQAAQLHNYSELFGSMSDVAGAFAGEQSGIFKAMFAASKAFSIAESIIKIQQGIANAAALPFPANIGAMATVASTTAGIVNTIKGTNLQGMAHNGISSVPNEGTWLLDKGERVYTNDSAKQLDQMYDSVMAGKSGQSQSNANGGNGNISINVNEAPPGTNVETYYDHDKQTQIINIVCKDIQTGGNIAQALGLNYGLKRQGFL
ncbi:TPA: hypothetical protein NJ686_004584 [Vibrio parahaemolyticus]|nr:hypothetical protein [Vibrio parahaemolyticus]